MRKGLTFWVICLSLVFTRLIGLHLHACVGIEADPNCAGTHYEDNGLLFGEHCQDDDDDRDVQFVAVLGAKVKAAFPDLFTPLPAMPSLAPAVAQLRTVATPHGPPLRLAAHPSHFAPPLRGPPISLA